MPSMSCGLTRNACGSSSAAPVNSLSTSAPCSSCRHATYSLATRFMPSRSGVTSITSAGQVQRGHLLPRVGLVQVVHGRVADLAVLAVDPAHHHLDLVPQRLVLLDPFPARAGHLDQHRPRSEPPVGDQLAVGPQPVQDALGVVQSVDAQQHQARLAQRRRGSARTVPDVVGRRAISARPFGVDRDRERRPPGSPASRPARRTRTVDPLVVRPTARRQAAGSWWRRRRRWKPEQVGAEQALAPPAAATAAGRRSRSRGTGCG